MYTREPRCCFELLTYLPYDEVRLIIRDLMTQNYHKDGKVVLMGELDTITIEGQTVTRYRGKADSSCLKSNSGYDHAFEEWRDSLSAFHSSYGLWKPGTDRDRYLSISCRYVLYRIPGLLREYGVIFGKPELKDLYCIHEKCPHVVHLVIVPILGP